MHGINQKRRGAFVVHDCINTRVVHTRITAARLINPKLLTEHQLTLYRFCILVDDRKRTNEGIVLIMHDIISNYLNPKPRVRGYKTTHQRVGVRTYDNLPLGIFKPRHLAVTKNPNAMHVVTTGTADVVSVPNVRVVKIAHLAAVVEANQDVSITQCRGTSHSSGYA